MTEMADYQIWHEKKKSTNSCPQEWRSYFHHLKKIHCEKLVSRRSYWTEGVHTSEESLHLDTVDPSLVIVTENLSADIDDAIAVEEQLQFAVGLTSIIEPNMLTDVVPNADFEVENPATNGGTICGVAFRFQGHIANLVGSKFRIGVRGELTAVAASSPPSNVY